MAKIKEKLIKQLILLIWISLRYGGITEQRAGRGKPGGKGQSGLRRATRPESGHQRTKRAWLKKRLIHSPSMRKKPSHDNGRCVAGPGEWGRCCGSCHAGP
eukprot:1030431-Pleurochrysis_carterae.AAC.1